MIRCPNEIVTAGRCSKNKSNKTASSSSGWHRQLAAGVAKQQEETGKSEKNRFLAYDEDQKIFEE